MFVLAIGCVTLGLYVYLYYKQRAIYRAIYVVDIGSILWLLYYYADAVGRLEEKSKHRLIAALSIVFIVIAVVLTPPLVENCHNKESRAKRSLLSEEAADYLKEHNDTVFVWGTGERKRTYIYTKPWLAPEKRDKNVFETGGWETMSPYIINRLNGYDMYNPIKDLIDNDRALYVGNECIEELENYLTDWYAEQGHVIRMKETGTIDNLKVWKVVSE